MTEPINRTQYAAAVSLTVAWKEDRLNRGDKAIHWTTVHQILTEHAPPKQDSTTCSAPDCAEQWPCSIVNGAVKDTQMGPAGW